MSAGVGERFTLVDQSDFLGTSCEISQRTQLSFENAISLVSCGAVPGRPAGRGAEEINPDGTIDQDQPRVLQDALRSPLQTPLP